MSNSFNLFGIDIGGTKIVISLGASDGKILGSKRIPSHGRGPDEVMPELFAAGHQLLEEANMTTEQLQAIGIGAPAPADIPNGILTSPVNNQKWRDVPIRDLMANEFKTETFFDNDANAGVLAEWMFGAAVGGKNVIYLTLSTGIGGGIIANGKLVHGTGFFAGEIGHICLDPNGPQCSCGMHGCYEAFCGGVAVAKRVQLELATQPEHPIVKYAGGEVDKIDMIAIEKAVRDGNNYAVRLWEELSLRHAQAIGAIINIFNPDKVILGTMAWATGELFMEPLMKHLPDYCWSQMLDECDVVPSKLERAIGDYAGLAVALNYLYEAGKYQLPVTG
ncbi:MAG: ROK family protein [Victivallaceae bacterium]|nr:ROK family protein [Victivallaceae bacterium]